MVSTRHVQLSIAHAVRRCCRCCRNRARPGRSYPARRAAHKGVQVERLVIGARLNGGRQLGVFVDQGDVGAVLFHHVHPGEIPFIVIGLNDLELIQFGCTRNRCRYRMRCRHRSASARPRPAAPLCVAPGCARLVVHARIKCHIGIAGVIADQLHRHIGGQAYRRPSAALKCQTASNTSCDGRLAVCRMPWRFPTWASGACRHWRWARAAAWGRHRQRSCRPRPGVAPVGRLAANRARFGNTRGGWRRWGASETRPAPARTRTRSSMVNSKGWSSLKAVCSFVVTYGREIQAVAYAVAIVVVIPQVGRAIAVGVVRHAVAVGVQVPLFAVADAVVVAVDNERVGVPGLILVGEARHLDEVGDAVRSPYRPCPAACPQDIPRGWSARRHRCRPWDRSRMKGRNSGCPCRFGLQARQQLPAQQPRDRHGDLSWFAAMAAGSAVRASCCARCSSCAALLPSWRSLKAATRRVVSSGVISMERMTTSATAA